MGSRSRKRIRSEASRPAAEREHPTTAGTPAPTDRPATKSNRIGGPATEADPPPARDAGPTDEEAARPTPRPVVPEPEDGMAAAYAARTVKTEAKNQAVRDTLEPLGPGERPPWVTYAAILAFGLGALNIGLYAAGVRVEGATIGGTVLVGLILVACAGGMWMARYSAVLAFEVLLGITAAFAALSLLVASSVAGALRSVVVVAVCGTFFWKLIRAMARMQMPARPGEQRR